MASQRKGNAKHVKDSLPFLRPTAPHSEPGFARAGALWICKPTDSSRGRNIFLLRDLRHLTYDMPILVQRYVDRPLTVGGYKFDLRL